jgi:hypothetical protein
MSPKSRKRKRPPKKRQTRSRGETQEAAEYTFLPSPFEGLTREAQIEDLIAMGADYQKRYEESFERLRQEILRFDPLMLLSCFSLYSQFRAPGRDPEVTQTSPILQHHVEMLQALILTSEPGAYEDRPLNPPSYEEIADLVLEAARGFHVRRLAELDASMPEQQVRRIRALNEMRVHTQAVRNWGYPHQVKEVVTQLFDPLNEEIEIATGIRIDRLLEMCFKIVRLIETKPAEHVSRLRPASEPGDLPT